MSFLKIAALVCFISLLVVLGLMAYHFSIDPYSWLESNYNRVESHDLWVERKDLYLLLAKGFFIGTIAFGLYPILKWLMSR